MIIVATLIIDGYFKTGQPCWPLAEREDRMADLAALPHAGPPR
jgi:hypothetical protein